MNQNFKYISGVYFIVTSSTYWLYIKPMLPFVPQVVMVLFCFVFTVSAFKRGWLWKTSVTLGSADSLSSRSSFWEFLSGKPAVFTSGYFPFFTLVVSLLCNSTGLRFNILFGNSIHAGLATSLVFIRPVFTFMEVSNWFYNITGGTSFKHAQSIYARV